MKTRLKEILLNRLNNLNYPVPKEINIEVPKDKKNGDYATNIALMLTKDLKQAPLIIAEEIVKELKDETIEKIEIAPPGFINFYLKKDYLLENIKTVLKEKENYGRSKLGNNEKINLEYVSANPTGTLHLGHARGAAFGDSLSRILKFAGYDVTREFYINDAGNQINNLGKSIKARYLELCGEKIEFPVDGYHGKEIIEIAQKIYNEKIDKCKEEDLSFFKQYGLNILLDDLKKDLKQFGVEYDVWTSEQSLYDKGKVEEAINTLKDLGMTYKQDGAIFLKTSAFGDDKDHVLIKSDGNNTYLVPDIAYHINKMERGFGELVNVLGADHHGYVKRLKASLEMLGYDQDKIHILLLQMVRVIKDGAELKMSKRTGNAITLHEIVEEVGADAARYMFVSRSLDTQMDFDIDLLLKKTNENPIYYVNYAHARICSILKSETDLDYENIEKFETTFNSAAYNVLAKVYEWPEVVERSAKKKEVHLVTNYIYELATLFHNYYATEKIKTDNNKETRERLALIASVKITLKNALSLIGVEAYEKM